MTKAENNNQGTLNVDLNYQKVAQDVMSAIYHHKASIRMLETLMDRLDVAAIKKGLKEKERRLNSERRNHERRR